MPFSSINIDFSFPHVSFELAQLSFAFQYQSFHRFCSYRPPPRSKNDLKDSLSIEGFSEQLTFCNALKGSYAIVVTLISTMARTWTGRNMDR